MKEIYTEIEIKASPADVWKTLTTFEEYPEWNPLILSASGEAAPGKHVKMKAIIAYGFRMTFHARVLIVEPLKELRWMGMLWLPGFFRGEHAFEIEPTGSGSIRLIQKEIYKGIFAPIFYAILKKPVIKGFDNMNRALKERTESNGVG